MYEQWLDNEANTYESGGSGRLWTIAAGAMLGAGVMFLLDPRGGGRRRAPVRDKIVRGSRAVGMYADKGARNLANHARGAWEERKAQVRDLMRDIPEDVLVDRVRAQIGHVVSHPGSIEVTASNGVVHLRGPVLRGEIDKIRKRLEQTRGVGEYNIELTEHEDASSIPGLQGESRDQRRERWGT